MEIKITITVDEGKLKDVKVDKIADEVIKESKSYSVYARCFDETCAAWERDAEHNLLFVKQTETYCNDLLKQRGHLFLNEVYEIFGFNKTKAGQIVGWVYDEENPVGDNYVDFGIHKDINKPTINGYEKSIWLDFNVDGNIMDILS
jgi:hypothetical protein